MPTTEQLRIAVTSDLHWEIGRTALERRAFASELANALAEADPDVVVIAGDVGNGPRSTREALGYLSVGRLANLYVPGNHDVWLTDREREDGTASSFVALDALGEACAATGFRYLPGNPIVVDGVGFAGSLGWYDYAFRSPEVPANYDTYRSKRRRGSFNQDGWFAAWLDGDHRLPDEEVAARFEAALTDDLDHLGLDAEGAGPPTVAVTHMLPYRELIRYRGPADWSWDFMSAFMGSPGLGVLYDRLPAVRAVVAGHTHTPFAIRDGLDRELVVSPVGYANGPEYPEHLSERVAVLVVEKGAIRREETRDTQVERV